MLARLFKHSKVKMEILYILLYLLLAGLVVWLFIWVLGLIFPNIPAQVKNIILAILVILALIWVFSYTGLLSHVPRLSK